jgi:hypothetical protein
MTDNKKFYQVWVDISPSVNLDSINWLDNTQGRTFRVRDAHDEGGFVKRRRNSTKVFSNRSLSGL